MKLENELVFRIVFGLLWLLYFGIRIFFQRKVKDVGEYSRVNARQELLLFRLFALATFLLLLFCLSPWLDFAHLALPPWARWCGAGLFLPGLALFAWAHRALGLNWTAVLALSEKHRLVTGGPFRWIRHPMYTAFFVLGFGYLLLSANWLVGLVYFLPLTVMVATRLGPEERMMLERFGEEYRQYMARTGRLLPKLGK